MQYTILLHYFVKIINYICFTFFPGLKQLPSQHTLNTPVDTPLPPNTPSQKLQQQFFPWNGIAVSRDQQDLFFWLLR